MNENETISGMNFYCDLWCERCPLTDRCESYPMIHREDASTPEGFMQRQMQSITQMQLDFMATAGEFQVRVEMSDFFKITEAKSHHLSSSRIRRLVRSARDFGRLVSALLQSYSSEAPLGGPNMEAVSDAIDEIIWYKIQIQFRLTLAGILKIWEGGDSGRRRVSWLHSDGCAKAAMAAMDRFLVALRRSRPYEWGDTAIAERLTSEVEELRGEVLTNFPGAADFQRPGFDEPEGMLLCAAPMGSVC